MSSITNLDTRYIAHTYNRFPVEIVRGEGALLYDTEGNEYIDMGSGIGSSSFGACDEQWKAAVIEQLNRIQHTSNLYYSEPDTLLAEALCKKTGMSKVFFCNSGAEANECAIKLARKYSADKYGANRSVIVSLVNSFHGRTLTTLAATGQEHFHELFQPLTPGFDYVVAGDIEALKRRASQGDVAGILMECVQGEGGVVALDNSYVTAVADLARTMDIVLCIDEVQTGNGRTGALYAYMHYGISPDVVTTAKGLGGGLPIGACLMSEKMATVLGPGDHGSTFGGNPVCCSGALSIIQRLDDAFLASVSAKAQKIRQSLEGASGIKEVTGLGLMIGLVTEKPARDIVGACIGKGVLCLTAKDRVRLLPPLNIPDEVLDKALIVIKEACAL